MKFLKVQVTNMKARKLKQIIQIKKQKNKMSSILKIILNMNDLNIPIKR
jgi:hypothetical protein